MAYFDLLPSIVRAKRLSGDFEASIKMNDILKKSVKRPVQLSTATKAGFEEYVSPKIEEIFTLLAKKNAEQARAALLLLLDDIGGLTNDSEDLFYTTTAWTNLQYLTVTFSTQQGKWNSVLIDEMVSDLLHNNPTSEIFYPAQLLSIKGKWRNDKKLHLGYLENLLVYTQRQLEYNFIFLSAEERMQLYANRLNDIFDVYHELLFSSALDVYPELKEKVLSQSLHLKNALADGNIIEDDVFLKGNSNLNKELLNQVRSLRQRTKRHYQEAKFQNIPSESSVLNDKMQSMWLGLIDDNKEKLIKKTDWKIISQKLKPNQVYLETVRYNRMLTDSAAVYGGYIIKSGGKINSFSFCNEKELIALLNKENSSPQCASLKGSASRGSSGILTGEKSETPDFKEGDVDELGQLVLKNLWPHIAGKSELLMAHDGLLNRISFAALQWDKKYLINYLTLRHFSGSSFISENRSLPLVNSKVLLAGGIDYGQNDTSTKENRLFKSELLWQYLPGTKSEIEMLQPLFDRAGYKSEIVSGIKFTDSLETKLGDYQFIHLATHGFYFGSKTANAYFENKYNRDAMNIEPLYRCGLAITGANNPPTKATFETLGFIMGYELANIDLRNCYLITLSACETGLGDLRNNLGVDGLSRALKIAGAKNLLISLWKVPDEPTAMLMKQFYENLFSGKSAAIALQDTQKTMSKIFPASAWGAFILVE